MTASYPIEGAGIKCVVCGARPFAAEWGLPPELECFDLVKRGGKWGCPKHRAATKPLRPPPEDKAETLLHQLRSVIETMEADFIQDDRAAFAEVDGKQKAEAFDLIDRIAALI
jgi:hypothetical protein